MPDARVDFAFAIGITNATRQRHGAVREDISIERIERRIVDVQVRKPFLRLSRTTRRTVAPIRPNPLVQFRLDLRARVPQQ